MRLISTIFALTVLAASGAYAQSGYTYDYRTGNAYRYHSDTLGNTTVYGSNAMTGSNWNTRIQRNGNMTGQDAGGNFWNYNSTTGNYYNYGTGTSCFGKGYLRNCY